MMMAAVIVMVVVMGLVMMLVAVIVGAIFDNDIELHGADIRANDTRRLEFVTFDRQLVEFGSQVLQVEAQIQQCTNRHVSADA